MERGVINTRVGGNALDGTWTVENVWLFKLSPLITFDAFDKFKLMFRLKVQVNNGVVSYFIQTKGFYGVIPKRLTILVGRGPKYPNCINYIPDTSWQKTGDELSGQSGTTIHFKIELVQSKILELYSPECNFSNIWKQPGADITIEGSDGQQKNVHKTVLLARSDVFRAMWQNLEMVESKDNHLKIPELDEDSLSSFVSYLYHGTIEDCNLNKCFTLLHIADKYNIKHLIMKCQNTLQMEFSKDNAIEIYFFADLHNLQHLKDRTIKYILTNVEAVVLTNAWRETNESSFFKHVYQELVQVENKVVTTGKISQSLKQTNHCLEIKFPIDTLCRSDRLYQMTVSPESGYGTFIIRVLEKDATYFKLSLCQYKYDGNYLYTNVNFTGEVICEDETPIKWYPTSTTNPNIPLIAVNEWYDLALFKIFNKRLMIILKMSYDIKYTPKNCAFAELLTDSSSADMSLESSDGVFRQVHKAVLIARNLHAMVNQCDSKDHLKLCDLGALALNEFINFIYIVHNGELNVDYCAELLTIAHKYHLPAMKYECETKLKTTVSTTSALELLSLAVLNEAMFLEQWILDFIHLNQLEITKMKNWQNCNNCNCIKRLIEHHLELKEVSTVTTIGS